MNFFKPLNNYSKWYIYVPIVSVILYILLSFTSYKINPPQSEYVENNYTNTPIGEITDGIEVVQTIPLQDTNNVNSISLLFATYARNSNTGTVNVQIFGDESGILYASQDLDASLMLDNSFEDIALSQPVNASDEKSLRVVVTSNSEAGSAVTIWSSAEDIVADGELTINGVKSSGDLVYKISAVASSFWNIHRFIMIFACILYSLVIMTLIFSWKNEFVGNIGKPRNACIKVNTTQKSNKVGFLSLLAALALILYTLSSNINKNFENLQVSELIYYGIVAFFAVFVYLEIDCKPYYIYAFVMLCGIVWIIGDRNYNVIDEDKHANIINYIIDKNCFPGIKENYEAVQGPVYYYLMAFLTRFIPESQRYIACRFWGLILLIGFGLLGKILIKKISDNGFFEVETKLQNLVWLLFFANPAILIRFTRVSNEPLVAFIAGIVLLITVDCIISGYQDSKVLLCTFLCACAFLTKATSAFLFGSVLIICCYYKKWSQMLKNTGLIFSLIAPWFANNYFEYGALTAMQGHLDIVLPIVNPEKKPVNIIEGLVCLFDNFFLHVEAGIWYISHKIDTFLSVLLMLLFGFICIKSLKYLASFVKTKLDFSYHMTEKRRILFFMMTALPAAEICMQIVSSIITYIQSISGDRYYFMLNGAFSSLLLFCISHIKIKGQHYVSMIGSTIYSVIIVSMICGYMSIILTQCFVV